MSKQQVNWLPLAEQLETALTASPERHDRPWAGQLAAALDHIEKALAKPEPSLPGPDGTFAGAVPVSQTMMPAVERRMDHIREEQGEIAEEIHALHAQVTNALEASAAMPEAVRQPIDANPDLDRIRERGMQLAGELRRHQEAEDRLVLESVTTEIGAGD